jgi:hypothetical protein
MRELFLAFLKEPTAENFRTVRDLVVNAPNYDGYGGGLDQMRDAYNQKRFDDLRTAFGEAQPNLLLSPEAHFLLSLAARELGDAEGAEFEKFVCFRCIDGIRTTGEGTQEKPYLVLRTSDEYDVLNALGKQLQSQALVHGENGRSYDKMTLADGSEVWFDITDLFGAMARRLNSGGS